MTPVFRTWKWSGATGPWRSSPATRRERRFADSPIRPFAHSPAPRASLHLSRENSERCLVLACVRQLRFDKSQTLLMIKVLEPRLLRGEAELIEERVSLRRDRGLWALRFRQVAPPTE